MCVYINSFPIRTKNLQQRGEHISVLIEAPTHLLPLHGLIQVRVVLFLCLSKDTQLIGLVQPVG